MACEEGEVPGMVACLDETTADPVVQHVETSTTIDLSVSEKEDVTLINAQHPCYDSIPPPPPPSYNSIFGHLAEIKATSDGPSDTLRKSAAAVGDTVGGSHALSGCMLCTLILPVVSIVMGAVYLNDCQVERLIPIYLIVMGVFSIVKNVDSLYSQQQLRKRKREGIVEEESKKSTAIGGIVGCFLSVWFICGNVWIYSNYNTVSYVAGKNYCNRNLYLFAFWMTTVVYIFVLLFCFIGFCVGFAISFRRTFVVMHQFENEDDSDQCGTS